MKQLILRCCPLLFLALSMNACSIIERTAEKCDRIEQAISEGDLPTLIRECKGIRSTVEKNREDVRKIIQRCRDAGGGGGSSEFTSSTELTLSSLLTDGSNESETLLTSAADSCGRCANTSAACAAAGVPLPPEADEMMTSCCGVSQSS